MFYMSFVIMFFVVVFAAFEKVFKEKFVLNYTNERSRKVLLEILDSTGFANVLISPNGKIIFFNKSFKTLLNEQLDLTEVPKSIYALTEGDVD